MDFSDKETWLDKITRREAYDRAMNSAVPSSAFSIESLSKRSVARSTVTDYKTLPIKLNEPDAIGPRTYFAGLSDDGKTRFGF